MVESKKCEIVSKSLLRNSSNLPSDKLKKFCLGLLDWCPCCIEEMVEKENSDNALILVPAYEMAEKENSDDAQIFVPAYEI